MISSTQQPTSSMTVLSSSEDREGNGASSTNVDSLITSVESIEDISTSRSMNTSQIPNLLQQSTATTNNSDHHATTEETEEGDEPPFEISVIGNTGVIAIALKDKQDYIHSDIIPAITKKLDKLFRLAKAKPKIHKYSRLSEIWEEFKEWFGTNAWEVFLFRLFDCLIVMSVLFCMRKILPTSISRLLEWFIDPVDEGFPYSQQEQ
ncbi:predicted protein [Naegleria gruberi]|uniref:Predicted protein n=1 Tax=Naegleria gruberi TaxID=5762 RepID=D2V1R7_NAEGR|nr:uncharacterized protein NAEGRDRAFT_62670 [Naegleria gruberi]EFC49208.1 predicted protein [Naegleria gruberi]|eukprot:XP_002681952.1 predicted protein [Naegleria gruberi strain NEG-M]